MKTQPSIVSYKHIQSGSFENDDEDCFVSKLVTIFRENQNIRHLRLPNMGEFLAQEPMWQELQPLMISRLLDWASPQQYGLVSRLVLGWEQISTL